MSLNRRQLLSLSDSALLSQCEVDRFRGSGPGGQKRNKTDSAVRIRHQSTGISAQASESRSQHINRTTALSRLRESLALDHREPVPRGYVASDELQKALRQGPRTVRSKLRFEFAYLVALGELLDVFAEQEARVAASAQRIGVGSAALTRLLCGDAHAARRAAALRKQFGLGPLRR